MEKLIREGLRFGGLVRVSAPHLIERYNAALEAFRLPRVALDDFHLDASGYSLEVADALGDMNYLDPKGINRRFIIVTPEQRNAPLIAAAFSVDAALFELFYAHNQAAIEALTLKDAVYGEIENLVFDVQSPADIVSIRKVSFGVYTPSWLLADARSLEALTTRFMTEIDGWRDEGLMAEIVEGAKRCGDIRANGIIPEKLDFDWPAAFFSTHFGGTYVFHYGENVLLAGDPERLQPRTENMRVIERGDGGQILDALDTFGLIEPFNPRWLVDSGMLEQRLRMAVADVLGRNGIAFAPHEIMDERYLNRWVHESIDRMQADPAFRAISGLRGVIGNDGDAAGFEAALEPASKLIFRRALPEHPGVWEANRLIAEFSEFDVVALFILNKPRFYELYEAMSAPMRAFSVDAVKTVYMPDGIEASRRKDEVKARLYGAH